MESINVIIWIVTIGAFAALLIECALQHSSSKRALIEAEQKLEKALRHQSDLIAVQNEKLNAAHAALHDLKKEKDTLNSTLTALLGASTYGIFASDSNMQHIRYFNNAFCTMWELAEGEINIGMKVYDVLKHCMKKTLEPEILFLNFNRINHSRDIIWSNQIQLPNKKVFQISSSPICGFDGTYYGRIWEFIDVTEHIQREQSLSEAHATIRTQYDVLAARHFELDATINDLRAQYSTLKKIETNLEVKNSLLSALLETSSHGILAIDSQWQVLHFNKQFCEMWNLPENTIHLGSDADECFSYCTKQTTNPDQFISHLREIRNSQDMVSEHHFYLPDGRVFQNSSSPAYKPDGTYYGRIWEVTDVTDNVRKEQELSEAYIYVESKNVELAATEKDLEAKNSLFSTVLEASTHGTISVDSQWRIQHFNKNFCKMWHLAKDEVYVGVNGIEFLMAYCIPQTMNPDRFLSEVKAIFTNQDVHWEGKIYMSDGRVFQSTSSPILGPGGTLFGRIWEMRDITEDILKQQNLERAYTELMQKDNQLTLALEGAGEGLWTLDILSELVTVNPEFASQYRSLNEKQSLNSFISAIHPDEREQCLNRLRETAEKIPDTGVEFEFRLQPNEGMMWCWIMARGTVSAVDDNGLPLKITGIFLDITERKMYERHLREVSRKMLILSQITRHDTVNQLTKLFGFSALIYDEIADDSIKKVIEQMEQSLAAVMNIVTFSKDYQELGIHGAEWQDVNACIKNGKQLLVHPPVEIVTDKLPMIWADPLLEKAVYNLIDNALRHGEHVTMIKVTFSVGNDDSGLLIFEDNGVGVPDENKEKIFDLSFGKNTGLGLFLIREILGLTNMSISECGQFGQGARFEITISPGYWKW